MTVKGQLKVLLGVLVVGMAYVALAPDSKLSAQQRPAPEQPRADVNAALLAEVRALRADLAQSNQASLRAQLLVARVQLQEQRIIYFDRRRADLAARTAEAAEKVRDASAELQTVEGRLRQLRTETPQIPKEQLVGLLETFEEQVKKQRADVQAAFEFEQRLRVEEADVQSVLSAEQGRWNDFNARLDELERAIPK